VDGFLVADTTRTEEDSDGAVLTLACMPSTQEVTLLSEKGDLTQDGAGEPEQALQLAINGCVNIANLMRDSLVKSVAK
jgi:ribonuclease PH